LQEIARQVDGALAAHADTQIDGQQLGVGQGFRPMRQQPFARAFALGPVGDRHAVSSRMGKLTF